MAAQDQRPRFYEGQYLAADDLDAVVEYAHVAVARHELGSHTWGIVLGFNLIERATPGAPERRDVLLTPGVAVDGFARTLVGSSTVRLPESLFANIAYDASVDDPAKTNGKPMGRFVRVWIAYDETAAKSPAPGFERCDAGNDFARVKESFRFVIGDKTALADRRSPLTIGAVSVDAENALRQFDSAAPLVRDTSIPQQRFPEDNRRAIWLIPIGWVRWVVYAQGGGYFVDRNIVATDKGDDRIRKVRTYVGVVAENIHASDGALVLRNRFNDPTASGSFQDRLQSADALTQTFADLVWVEGNLRVVGDERIAGGALLFANRNGSDEDTRMSIERLGDGGAAGNRSLDVLIGPDATTSNRFAVATIVADDPDPTKRQLDEKFTVMSSGNVGVGQSTPTQKLHVKGARIRLESTDTLKTLDLRTDGSQVDLESRTNDLYIRSTGGAPAHNVIINPDAPDGNVGIGNASPKYKLDVKSKGIKLGLEDNGGGQLILSNTAGDNKIRLEGFNSAGTAPAVEMLLTANNGSDLPRLSLYATSTYVKGKLGVGLDSPAYDLDVKGTKIKLGLEANGGGQLVLANNAGDNKIFLEGFSSDGTSSAAEMLLTGRWATALPQCSIIANTTYVSGNLGVGTGVPADKLHVAGQFLRVDGLLSETAAIGSEGNASVVFGTRKSSVQLADMRNLTVGFDTTDAGAWLTVWCRDVHEVSDERAKQNIRSISGALDKVTKLRGVSYEWKNAAARELTPSKLGLIAQEVHKVVPEAVTINERGAGLSYSSLVPLLIEAVKELKSDNASLRAELDSLKESIEELREDVAEGKTKMKTGPSKK